MSFLSGIKNFFKRLTGYNRIASLLTQIEEKNTYQYRIISDGILLNEIPSPSDREEMRGEFIKRRLTEFGIESFETDDSGNIFVIFPGGKSSESYLLVYSDIDNPIYSASESIVEMKDNKLFGIGIGDNSIGASALLVLCEIIKKHNYVMDNGLIALFSFHNTPESNFEGIRAFMEVWKGKISSSLYLSGNNLGKMVVDSTGLYNLSFAIRCHKNKGECSSVDVAVLLYQNIMQINWNEFSARVNVVRISSGIGFEYFPLEGDIDIEIFSKNREFLNQARDKIIAIAAEISSRKKAVIECSTKVYMPPADARLNEIPNEIVRKIHGRLNITTIKTNIPDSSSIINQYGVASVNLGITSGIKTMNEEFIETAPIANGFKQVLFYIDALNQLKQEEN